MIEEVLNILQKELADDAIVLGEQLRRIEPYYASVGFKLAEAEAELSIARARHLPPKTKDMTETDRNIRLEGAVAKEKKLCDELAVLLKAIDKRLGTGQSLLKFHGIEIQRYA